LNLIYDNETLQQINENVDLLGYVEKSIDLEEKGGEYWGHCPLHVDNTPSFSLSPEKNAYYCFSCGSGGGIINFLVDYEDMTFDDAVTKASQLANMDLSKMCQSRTIAFLKKLRAMSQVQKIDFQHKIFKKTELKKYLKDHPQEWIDEGIDPDVMDLFDIRIDEYGNRIVYPVYDIDGNLINIKGRTRYENFKQMDIPKYINYYTVGVVDYFQGLNVTLPYVKEQNEIIIFESIKSVMKAYGWGYRNCASAEKHTLTKEQIDLLIKLRVNVVFAYDSDVSYREGEVKENIDKLKRVTNVYIIEDREHLLGGKETKNAPADCGEEIWEELYESRKKVV